MKLEFLRPLYREFGGYLSVYTDTDRTEDNAPEEMALRWRSAAERLSADGADDASVAAVAELLNDPARAAPGRAVFARAGEVAFTAPMSRRPRREIARLAPLPHLLPLLAQDPPPAAHLRISATRSGGELVAVDANQTRRDSAEGPGWPVHKTRLGGWSQARFQRSAEEAWEVNGKDLAAQVTQAATEIHAELLVLAGDARARSLLLRHLGPARAQTVIVEQEVPVDSPALEEAAGRAVADVAEEECRRRFDEWPALRHRGAGVDGLPDVLAALRDAQVADLFVLDRPGSAAIAWVGPESADIATSEAELRERGVVEPVPDRADAAIIRAVAMTEARLHFLPADLVRRNGEMTPRDGICASLRSPR